MLAATLALVENCHCFSVRRSGVDAIVSFNVLMFSELFPSLPLFAFSFLFLSFFFFFFFFPTNQTRGRFDRHVFVELPDAQERLEWVASNVTPDEKEVDELRKTMM